VSSDTFQDFLAALEQVKTILPFDEMSVGSGPISFASTPQIVEEAETIEEKVQEQDFCSIHQVRMTQRKNKKDNSIWYSHEVVRTDMEVTYCNGSKTKTVKIPGRGNNDTNAKE
jgi:hypothetical protein